MGTKEDLINELAKVMHPEINHSLIDLGIIKNIEIIENKAKMIFSFPFPDIPIADVLIKSIEKPVKDLGFNLSYNVRIMTEEEKNKFMIMESEAWKGGV
jgi:metal-sulfur cluster biosynthetic enzyme